MSNIILCGIPALEPSKIDWRKLDDYICNLYAMGYENIYLNKEILGEKDKKELSMYLKYTKEVPDHIQRVALKEGRKIGLKIKELFPFSSNKEGAETTILYDLSMFTYDIYRGCSLKAELAYIRMDHIQDTKIELQYLLDSGMFNLDNNQSIICYQFIGLLNSYQSVSIAQARANRSSIELSNRLRSIVEMNKASKLRNALGYISKKAHLDRIINKLNYYILRAIFKIQEDPFYSNLYKKSITSCNIFLNTGIINSLSEMSGLQTKLNNTKYVPPTLNIDPLCKTLVREGVID